MVVSGKTQQMDSACLLSLFLQLFFHLAVRSFDGVAGALVIILDHDSIGWQTSALEGAWATIPAFDRLSVDVFS